MGFTMIVGWNVLDGSSEAAVVNAHINVIMKQIEKKSKKRRKK